MLQAEVDETMKRLQNQKGVQGIIIVNAEGTWHIRNVAAVITCFSLVVMCFSMELIRQRDLCCCICSFPYVLSFNRHPH